MMEKRGNAMFLVEYFFAQPEQITVALRERHLAYLAPAYQSGELLLGGPVESGKGGLLLSRHADIETLLQLLNNDPFVLADLASFQITPFNLKSTNPAFKQWLIEHPIEH